MDLRVLLKKCKNLKFKIMGLSFIKRCSSITPSEPFVFVPAANPQPDNFKVISVARRGEFRILEVIYPNCTNYEGLKILLVRSNLTRKEFLNLKWLDPHFQEELVTFKINDTEKYYKILARFEPSSEGMSLCKKLIDNISFSS